jgi:elongation factor G
MAAYTTADIRNVLFAGSAGSGKTTLLEAILHKAGVIGRMGRIEDGNTLCDSDDLEKEFKKSLDSAIVHVDHAGAHLNLIDTPGSPDFIGKAISSIPAVETMALVMDAGSPIDTVARRLMKVAGDRGISRMIIVNKIDHVTDLKPVLQRIQETFGTECRPINLPSGGRRGVVECMGGSGQSDLGDVSGFATALTEQIVEVDESLMETYLEQGEVDPQRLRAALKQALREGHLIPVCFASARDEIGIEPLLNVFASVCLSPAEAPPARFARAGAEEIYEAAPDPDKPALAHVFKVSSDPFVGKLCVFRVHQGHIGPDVAPRVNDGRRGVRVSHVFKLQGKGHSEVPRIVAGDIGAVAKIDEIVQDAVLHAGDEDLRMQTPPMPRPMYGLAVEGTSKGAETKLGEALHKLTAEDATLVMERVAATGELVLRGMGEQHLRVKLRMLKDRYGVEVATRPPRVAYKETITRKAEGHHRHKKQTGGAGQFGEVYMRVEPINGAEEEVVDGLAFVDDTFGGSIPKQFLPAIEKGVRRVMKEGAIAGYPMHNIKVSVYDGKYHAVDSKEVAFVTAGRKAFIDAVQKAGPALLEPFVRLEITVPAGQIGDISSDLSGKRGRIMGTEMLPGGMAVVSAEAPLAEVMSYSSQLKSMTGGAGSYTMEYSHDERTPPNVQEEVVRAFKPRADEE